MTNEPTGYDPDHGPDEAWWAELGELDRIDEVEEQHRQEGYRGPEPRLHAIMHAIVESQILEGEATVRSTLERLRREGLDRHDAVHAIGSVLAPIVFELAQREKLSEPMSLYLEGLRRLTAEGWLADNA